MLSIDKFVSIQREHLLRDDYYKQNPGSLQSVLNTIRKHEELKREKAQKYGNRKQ